MKKLIVKISSCMFFKHCMMKKVFYILFQKYLGYWITGTTNINNTWKQWDTTAPVTPNWITL